jgi:cytochrome c oxidase cbb3-type subunit III
MDLRSVARDSGFRVSGFAWRHSMDFHFISRSLRTAALLMIVVCLSGHEHVNVLYAAPPEQKEPPSVPPKALHKKHVFVGKTPPPSMARENPFAGDPTAVTSGKQLFNAMHCDGCHGAGGAGAVGPNLADGRWRYGGSGAELFESIYAGRANGMPAYGGTTAPDAIWLLVRYLESLTPAHDPATTAW